MKDVQKVLAWLPSDILLDNKMLQTLVIESYSVFKNFMSSASLFYEIGAYSLLHLTKYVWFLQNPLSLSDRIFDAGEWRTFSCRKYTTELRLFMVNMYHHTPWWSEGLPSFVEAEQTFEDELCIGTPIGIVVCDEKCHAVENCLAKLSI